MKFQNGFAKMRIIETTKQYIAVDSIIAKPTNNVLVIVGAASGCCAIELKAVATAFPSLSAGNIQPIPVVSPAVTIDATAMIDIVSILILF
jgi:NADH:ubiquinone oxidoreductase subunit B-like Fe-S oxidoreductase